MHLRQETPDTADEAKRARLQARHTALGSDHWRSIVEGHSALGSHVHAEDFPEVEEIREIRAQVLFVHGDRDFLPVEEPTELYRLIPNAELCILPNTGHNPPSEHPDWFNAIALDFLARRYVFVIESIKPKRQRTVETSLLKARCKPEEKRPLLLLSAA